MLGELKRKQIGEGAFMNSVIEPKFKSDRISLCLVTPLKKEKQRSMLLCLSFSEKAAKAARISQSLTKNLRKCTELSLMRTL